MLLNYILFFSGFQKSNKCKGFNSNQTKLKYWSC